MGRIKFKKVKLVLTSEYWLLFSLSGVFLCFFARGSGANFFLNLTGIFLLIELLLGNYRIKQIPSWYLVVAAICAYLVLASVLNPYAYSKVRYIKRLVRMVILVFAIHCLSQKEIEDRIILLFGGMLILAVCWQFAAVTFLGKPYGTFTNPHYLADFAVLALPLIVYFIWEIRGWYKFIFVTVGILAAYLLLKTGSRPAFLAICCGALCVLIFFGKNWHRWLGIMLIFSIITVLYVTDYPVATTYTTHPITLKALIQNLKMEERIQFWQDAWRMQKDSSLIGWIFGSGIGSFRVLFPKYSVPQYSHFIFPHNFFLEVLYESGIVGFVLLFGGLGFLFYTAMIKARNVVNKRRSILLRCMIILFLMWFIYCGLVFPIYSNYTLIPLAFILGTMLVLLEKVPSAGYIDPKSKG